MLPRRISMIELLPRVHPSAHVPYQMTIPELAELLKHMNELPVYYLCR